MSDLSTFHALARAATSRFNVLIGACIYANDRTTASGQERYRLRANGQGLAEAGITADEATASAAVEALVKSLKRAKEKRDQEQAERDARRRAGTATVYDELAA